MSSPEAQSVTYIDCVENDLFLLLRGDCLCFYCKETVENETNSLKRHFDSYQHKQRFVQKVDTRPDYGESVAKRIFEEHVHTPAINFHQSHGKIDGEKQYQSYCYLCLVVIEGGLQGIKQHLGEQRHRIIFRKTVKQIEHDRTLFCCDCLVFVKSLIDHVTDEQSFHHCIYEDFKKYFTPNEAPSMVNVTRKIVELRESSESTSSMDNPTIKLDRSKTFLNLSEYCNFFLVNSTEEYTEQRKLEEKCVMKVEITWDDKSGKRFQPKGYFKPDRSEDQLYRLSVGDKVIITKTKGKKWKKGATIAYLPKNFDPNDKARAILFDGKDLPKKGFYDIAPKASKTVYLRQISALRALFNKNKFINTNSATKFLITVLLNQEIFSKGFCMENIILKKLVKPDLAFENISNIDKELNFKNKITLNESQVEAIILALSASPIILIKGPFATGKTKMICGLIKEMLKRKETIKILMVAPSNNGVDVIARLLDEIKVNVVREFSQRYVYIPTQAKKYTVLERAMAQDNSLRSKYNDYVNGELKGDEREVYKCELTRALAKVRETVNVVCTTCMNSGSLYMKESYSFDVVILDDSTHATEPELLVPIVSYDCGKFILLGDDSQLGPVVISQKAEAAGYGRSMFERLRLADCPLIPKTMLTVQYRMHEKISAFPSKQFYQNRLTNDTTVAKSTIKFSWPFNLDKPLLFFDIQWEEEKAPGSTRANKGEANFIIHILKLFKDIKSSVNYSIGVITFYDGQRRLLEKTWSHVISEESNENKKLLLQNVTIDSVDSFQSCEKDVIVISCVRSNNDENIGFLVDPRRVNVAITRAKKKLVVVGNQATLRGMELWSKYVDHIQEQESIVNNALKRYRIPQYVQAYKSRSSRR